MNLNWTFPYPSQRMPVFAENVVATSQPLAAQAGLQMLARGGNAVDAALAAAITLTVVEPTSNGLGSDAFAIIWDGKGLHGLNGSGRAPRQWSPSRFLGRRSMPELGWDAVTVPGAIDAWASLSLKFGKLPFVDLFESAIRYASEGFVVSPITAARWSAAPDLYRNFADFGPAFLPGGRAPITGELFRPEGMADTLKSISETRGDSFYRGLLGEKLVSCSSAAGGAMTMNDLEEHKSEWVQTLSQEWQGVTLHELPPNGQGLTVLVALGILDRLGIDQYPIDSADSLHLQIEAMKMAFALSRPEIADPPWMKIQPASLLEGSFLDEQASHIRLDRTLPPSPSLPADGGTVYLTAADQSGMMVSYIQSNYHGFGSGIVVPGTGISLQNRGAGFTLEAGHPNCVDGAKRPFHTIIPGFVIKNGAPLMSFGVMGAHMQAQGHLQMMIRIVLGSQNPQAAADAPRWFLTEESHLALEPGFSHPIRAELQRRGHLLTSAPTPVFGGAQIIYRLPDGYCAASDPRKDGQAVGY
jgi:gamma-glutamyltranspeptidase/glutathione hydrolase